jgi:alkylation response protein AidB-like acyl-CoA dehydrogenase
MIVEPVTLGPAELALKSEVRAFVQDWMAEREVEPGLGIDADHSPEFSRALAERGWVGMSIPREYGGHGRTAVDRFVVIEELLAAGAPINAHWIADRQTAPTLLAYGTEEQRRRFLPAIARGECYFSIGLSEPDSGSDLASVRTAATPVEGGWMLNGTKIWTSGAHANHFFVVLCRTRPLGQDRHEGLSQLIVDFSWPGIKVSPIQLLDGSHHFNEVALNDVFVPTGMLLGTEGEAWRQATSELAYERAGPDRFLSSFPVLREFLRERPEALGSATAHEALGRLTARYWVIRQLSLSVAGAIDAGQAPAIEAAMVKDLGTVFEQDVIATIQGLIETAPDPGSASRFERLLAEAVLKGPSFTIRGGTTEVLRSVAARALRKSS